MMCLPSDDVHVMEIVVAAPSEAAVLISAGVDTAAVQQKLQGITFEGNFLRSE